MSTDYKLVCDKCRKKSTVFHAQQAWGSWTDDSAHGFLLEHRDHKPEVVSEHDGRNDWGEYEEFKGENLTNTNNLKENK